MPKSAAINLFETAKSVKPATSAAGKKAPATLIEKLEVYAAIDHTVKWLKTLGETVKSSINEVATEKFVTDGCALKKQPENFDAKEGKATGNIQCKKRASNSALTDIEIELANRYDVPLTNDQKLFVFNPIHQAWLAENAAKVSAALAKLGAPTDIIATSGGDKTITTDDSIDFVFRTYADKPEVVEALLPVVGVIAVKPKFAEGGETVNNTAFDTLKAYLGREEEEEEEE